MVALNLSQVRRNGALWMSKPRVGGRFGVSDASDGTQYREPDDV